jgi:uncharacterized delta-60 repeat protein
MNLKLLLSTTLLSSVVLNAACGDPTTDTGPDAAVVEEATLRVRLSETKLPILQGTSGSVTVTIERGAGIDGPVTIAPTGLPLDVTFEPVTIPAGSNEALLVLGTDMTTLHSLPTTVSVTATAGSTTASADMIVTVYGAPGTLDTSLGKLMVQAGVGDDYAHAVAVQADGKIVIAGRGAEHLGDFAIIRLDRDGNLDATFGQGGRVLTDFAGASDTIYAVALQADGKIVVAGTTTGNGTSNDFAVARYLPNGDLDTNFDGDGKVVTALGTDSDTAYALAIQADGKILVGGDSNRGSGTGQTGIDFAIVRYTTTGLPDTSFDGDGIVTTSIASNGGRDSIYALALQPIDGEQRIVAVGGEGDFTVARYRANGALDNDFDGDGKRANLFGSTIGAARAVTITPANTIAIAGHSHHDVAIAQLTTSGGFDNSFDTDGKVVTPVTNTNWDEAQAITVESTGRLVVAGWAYEGNSSAGNFVVMRYMSTGTLDPSFGTTGIVLTPVASGTKADQAMALAIQPDDRIPMTRIVTAGFASVSNSDFAVARYWR